MNRRKFALGALTLGVVGPSTLQAPTVAQGTTQSLTGASTLTTDVIEYRLDSLVSDDESHRFLMTDQNYFNEEHPPKYALLEILPPALDQLRTDDEYNDVLILASNVVVDNYWQWQSLREVGWPPLWEQTYLPLWRVGKDLIPYRVLRDIKVHSISLTSRGNELGYSFF